METSDQKSESNLEYLLTEIIASADAYDRLAASNQYQASNLFFRIQQQQRTLFAHLLAHEYRMVHKVNWNNHTVAEHAYIHFPPALADGTMDPLDVEAWVIEKEQALVNSYQRVLASSGLPGVTYAIMESQAEEINNSLLKLRVDWQIHSNPVYT